MFVSFRKTECRPCGNRKKGFCFCSCMYSRETLYEVRRSTNNCVLLGIISHSFVDNNTNHRHQSKSKSKSNNHINRKRNRHNHCDCITATSRNQNQIRIRIMLLNVRCRRGTATETLWFGVAFSIAMSLLSVSATAATTVPLVVAGGGCFDDDPSIRAMGPNSSEWAFLGATPGSTRTDLTYGEYDDGSCGIYSDYLFYVSHKHASAQ